MAINSNVFPINGSATPLINQSSNTNSREYWRTEIGCGGCTVLLQQTWTSVEIHPGSRALGNLGSIYFLIDFFV